MHGQGSTEHRLYPWEEEVRLSPSLHSAISVYSFPDRSTHTTCHGQGAATHSSLASPHCPFFLCVLHVGDPQTIIWDTGVGILDSTKGYSCLMHIISFSSWKMSLDPHRGPELECLGGAEKRVKGLAPYDVFEEEGSVKGRLFQEVG